jgi:hypothetical protein
MKETAMFLIKRINRIYYICYCNSLGRWQGISFDLANVCSILTRFEQSFNRLWCAVFSEVLQDTINRFRATGVIVKQLNTAWKVGKDDCVGMQKCFSYSTKQCEKIYYLLDHKSILSVDIILCQ